MSDIDLAALRRAAEGALGPRTSDSDEWAKQIGLSPQTILALVEIAEAARECLSDCDLAPLAPSTRTGRQWCCTHHEWTPCSHAQLSAALAAISEQEGS
jgi:hypothetical protein